MALADSRCYAIMEEMAKLGIMVHTCSHNEAELSGCLKDWEGKGFVVTGSVCDVPSKAQPERLMETTVSSIFNGKLNILASGAGSIVFIFSVAGVVSLKNMSVYGATKGAMNQLTKNLACEWVKDNIRTNAAAPWYIKTSLVENVLKNKEYLEEVISRTPLKRLGDIEEVSSLVEFLCMPLCQHHLISLARLFALMVGLSVKGFNPSRD
ncbi:hypothetical protein SO802_018306 [Lithocarpus litseifolius]|uniref:Uncharacterized protein n=1 Tax=Lithocarpus litseifolius TaxID=425828 RepID=A0AAW2CMH5_9ROSI